MRSVTRRARPRAGLLGNPSDLYGGAGVAFTFDAFAAEVTLTAAQTLALPNDLLRAGWQVFAAHARAAEAPFEASFTTDIPLQVGLGGSSAIVVAFLRAAAAWHRLTIAPHDLARLALAAEAEVLGIRAGPMDRLAQSYDGLVQMDFREPFAPSSTVRLPAALLPPLVIALDVAKEQSSGQVHDAVWARYAAGDPLVRSTIAEYRPLVAAGVAALHAGDHATLRACVSQNFDLRARLFTIRARDRRMIEIGREHGAATKFCGSGGAILVVPRDAREIPELRAAYATEGFTTIVPRVTDPT